LANFHAAFHLFCQDIFSADLLYPECCHDFNLLNENPNIHEDFAAAEDISYCDRGIVDPHYDNHGDAFDIVLNANIKDGCHEDQIISFENFKDDEQMDISADDSFESAANTMDSLQLSDWQTKGDCSRYKEEDNELKSLDQQFIIHFPPIEKQHRVKYEITESHQHKYFNFQLEQQHKEVFPYDFDDPIADYLESMSSINVKIFLSEEGWFCHPFKMHFCILGIPLLFGSRSRMLSVNHFLKWLHWKCDFT
jgi:hypothetical protein